MERGKGAEGDTTVIPPSDWLFQKPTLCYGDSPHPTDANPEEATHLRGKGGLALHSNTLPHHLAPVAEEVHGQGQSGAREPGQRLEELRFVLGPLTCRHKEVNQTTKGK